eukprot:gene3587-4515_t
MTLNEDYYEAYEAGNLLAFKEGIKKVFKWIEGRELDMRDALNFFDCERFLKLFREFESSLSRQMQDFEQLWQINNCNMAKIDFWA